MRALTNVPNSRKAANASLVDVDSLTDGQIGQHRTHDEPQIRHLSYLIKLH